MTDDLEGGALRRLTSIPAMAYQSKARRSSPLHFYSVNRLQKFSSANRLTGETLDRDKRRAIP
jgi:hypothetical protein